MTVGIIYANIVQDCPNKLATKEGGVKIRRLLNSYFNFKVIFLLERG